MGKNETWACDVPDCLARSATNPIPLWLPTGQVPWRAVLGKYICPAHKEVWVLVDGVTLAVDK